MRVFAVLLGLAVSVESFSPALFHQATKRPHSFIKASPSDAIGFLESCQTQTVNKISSSIPVQSRPDLSWTPADGVTIAGCPAVLDGFEAPGANGNVAWMASVCVQSKMSSLTIYNGPLTYVPHLLSRCCVIDDNTLSFTLDFRPRAYGAYEMRDAEGNYPGPEQLGRKAFEYSGNRMEYDNNFGNQELIGFMQSTLASFEGAAQSSRPPTELDALTNGPLLMDVVMPLTEGNLNAIATARDKAADFWLRWATTRGEYDHRPGAPINAQYVYDTKYKQNAYGSLLAIYQEIFGPDGAALTAAESGPLDEAYVGGAS